MANQFFRFKQFTVHQQLAAMKVCTDSCILGAYAAMQLQDASSLIKNVLDIGTGTGLLSLMLAQKTTANITAIDIDKDAITQAKQNFSQSPWHKKLKWIETRLQDYFSATQFDCIISNPPFYENDLQSPDAEKNKAKHDTGLTLGELSSGITRLLSPGGIAFILLPWQRYETMKSIVKTDDLFILKSLHIRQTPAHDFFRTIIVLKKEPVPELSSSELIIHDAERNYTKAFIELMKDYYEKL
ncbi:MAG: methyltransferase [Ferruginibacter sp.]